MQARCAFMTTAHLWRCCAALACSSVICGGTGLLRSAVYEGMSIGHPSGHSRKSNWKTPSRCAQIRTPTLRVLSQMTMSSPFFGLASSVSLGVGPIHAGGIWKYERFLLASVPGTSHRIVSSGVMSGCRSHLEYRSSSSPNIANTRHSSSHFSDRRGGLGHLGAVCGRAQCCVFWHLAPFQDHSRDH